MRFWGQEKQYMDVTLGILIVGNIWLVGSHNSSPLHFLKGIFDMLKY